jgi:adenine phosphoribosyltransferase
MTDLAQDVSNAIRDVPDFPKPGILFKDITPVLADPQLFPRVAEWMSDQFRADSVDRIVGIESRGFILGAAMVKDLRAGFVPARKPGKLPYECLTVEYELEYGTSKLQMHTDALPKGARVLIVDDLLATGGTAAASIKLCRQLGATVVGCVFMVELGFLDGRKRLDVPIKSLVTY